MASVLLVIAQLVGTSEVGVVASRCDPGGLKLGASPADPDPEDPLHVQKCQTDTCFQPGCTIPLAHAGNHLEQKGKCHFEGPSSFGVRQQSPLFA